MRARPIVKKVRKNRFLRCPKCRKIVRIHAKRCATCHTEQVSRIY